MPLRGLVKWTNLIFIVFLMCPKRSYPAAPIGKQQEYFHAVRRTLNEVNNPSEMKFVPALWSSDIIKHSNGDELLGVDDEPGFDLTDDEIRKFKLWPKGIIPYYIDVLSFNDKVLRDRIRLFLNVINSVTSVSFLEMPNPPKDERTRWVFFINRRGQLGCADHSISNFTNEGVQQVILGYDCMSTGGELAEAVMSIAGIPPQHNAPNRDDYIKIIDANILPEKKYLFKKLNADEWLFYYVKYDFSSAGHFHYHKHSVNGRATIETQDLYKGTSMGENNGFSFIDIIKLRMLYNYIVKKKENKVPECDKLFRRGRNFQKRKPSYPESKPRKKPNLYLGLPEDHTEKPHSGEDHGKNSNEHHEKDTHEKIDKENDSKHGEGNTIEEESDHVDEHGKVVVTPLKNNKLNLKTQPILKAKHRMAKKGPDPLTYLSDYRTEDEKRKK